MGLLAPLSPTFDAALRDVRAKGRQFRLSAAVVLGEPERGRAAEAAEALAILARDDAAEVRAAALDSMGRVGSADLLDDVLRGLDDPSPAVREMAMAAAAAIGGERAQPALRAGLESEHPEVRFQALCGIARTRPPGLEPEVARLLHDPDAEVACEAATTLAALGAGAFAGALSERVESGPPRVKDAAAMALAHLGDPRAIPHLRVMVRERRSAFDAVLALGELGAREAAEDIASAAGGFFSPLFLRAAAGASLVRLGDPRGVALLRSSLRALRTDARSFAVEQIGRLGVAELVPDIVRLAGRPRGIDPAVLVEALQALEADHPAAKAALARLAAREASPGTSS